MTLEKLGGTFLRGSSKGKFELFSSDVSKKFGSQTVTKNKLISSSSGSGSSSSPKKSSQPDKSKVSPFLTGKVSPSRFIIPNNIGQSSNSGIINAPPVRQLQLSNIQPRQASGFFVSSLPDGGDVQVFSQTEVRTVDRIRQEQREARLINAKQKSRFGLITASNYGIGVLGGGKNILGETRPRTPTGIEFGKVGAKAFIDKRFPQIENPTFTFGGTFGEQGNLIRQSANRSNEQQIASILDNTQSQSQQTQQQPAKQISLIPQGKVAVVRNGGQIDFVKASSVAVLTQRGSIIGKLSTKQFNTIQSSNEDFFFAPRSNNNIALTKTQSSSDRLNDIFSGSFGSQPQSSQITSPFVVPEESTGRRFGNAQQLQSQSGQGLFGEFGGEQIPSGFISPLLPLITPSITANELGRIPIGIGVGAQNLGFFGFEAYNFARDTVSIGVGGLFGSEPFRVTKDAEGNVIEESFIGSKNPIPFTPTAIETLAEGAIGSIFASSPQTKEQSGRRFGEQIKLQPQQQESILDASIFTAREQFEADKGLNIGAGIFGALEIATPLPFGKLRAGGKVVKGSGAGDGLFGSITNIFKPNVKVNIIAPQTAGQKVIEQIKPINLPATELERTIGLSDTSKKLRFITDVRGGEKGETLGTIKTDTGIIPDTTGLKIDKAGNLVPISEKALKEKQILDTFNIEAGNVPTKTIGDDLLSPELRNISKGVNVEQNFQSAEIKAIRQEFKNKNNPFGRGDKDSKVIKGINNEEALKILKDRKGSGQASSNFVSFIDNQNVFIGANEGRIADLAKKLGITKSEARKILDKQKSRTSVEDTGAIGGDLLQFKGTQKQIFKDFPDDPFGVKLTGIGGKGRKGGSKQKTIFDEPNPKNKLNIFDKTPSKKPKLLGIGIATGVASGIGLGLFGTFDQGLDSGQKQSSDSRLGLIDDLSFSISEGTVQSQTSKLNQDQILGQQFQNDFGRFPSPNPQRQAVAGQPIPKLGLLQFQGNPAPLPFNFQARFDPFGSGGGGGSSEDKGDFSFFRVFAISKEPFGRTTIPLGGFVDSDRPINKIGDVLSVGEIFRENRRTRNPLRSPKNIVDEDPLINDLFGIEPKKKKGKGKKKKKSNDIFDLGNYFS